MPQMSAPNLPGPENIQTQGLPSEPAFLLSRPDDQPVLRILELLGRRWALRVVWKLRDGPLGFRDLQARGGGISSSVLARRLAELAEAGILAQDEGRRQCTISSQGRALARSLAQLEGWAARRS